VAQTSLGGLLGSSVNLEVIVVDTDNGSIGESSNFTSGSTDTTTDIENLHTGSDVDLSSEVVFLSCKLTISGWDTGVIRRGTYSLKESLSLVESTEVERVGPSVLVELGSTIIVAFDVSL